MKTLRIYATVFLALLILCGPSLADTLTFSLDTAYDGTPPTGSPPWLVAKFDELGPNRVQLTMSAAGLPADEYVGAWYFNLDPTLPLPDFKYISGPLSEITLGMDRLAAGPADGFDIGFVFTDKFTASLTAVYDFLLSSATATLLPDSFNFMNADGKYFSAASVTGSGPVLVWIAAAKDKAPGPAPISEPATMFLLGIGAFGLALFGKNRIKK